MTGGAFSVTTTPATIPGCSITFTPNINCRAVVYMVADVSIVTGGTSRLLVQARLDGVALTGGPRLIHTTSGDRMTIAGAPSIADLTAGVVHTLDLQASVDTVSSTFQLLGTTRLGPIMVGVLLY